MIDELLIDRFQPDNSIPECPYCTRPELFRKPVTKPVGQGASHAHTHGKGVAHIRKIGKFWSRPSNQNFEKCRVIVDTFNYGDHWRGTVPSSDFIARLSDFSVEIVGVHVRFVDPPPPPFTTSILYPNYAQALVLYSACTITHKDGRVSLDAHWWPSHGWKMNLHMNPAPSAENDDFKIAKDVMEFFWVETRGGAKITEREIRTALAKLGDKATQVATASAMNVSESALEKWRQRQGISTWQNVVKRYKPILQ